MRKHLVAAAALVGTVVLGVLVVRGAQPRRTIIQGCAGGELSSSGSRDWTYTNGRCDFVLDAGTRYSGFTALGRPGLSWTYSTEIDRPGLQASRRLAMSTDTRPRAPALLARIEKPDLEELPLESLRIATVLTPTRTRTLIDCTFSNTSARQLEGTFMVRLPDGASPCYLGVFQGAGVTSAKLDDPAALLPPPLADPALLLERQPSLPTKWSDEKSGAVDWGTLRPAHVVASEQGAVVYENVTRARIDPALMEWSGGNSFSTRIFPIPANGRKRVALIYDQPPLAADGQTLVTLAVPEKLPRSFRLEVAASTRAFERATLVTTDGEAPLEAKDAYARLARSTAPGTGALVLAATPRNRALSAAFGEADGVPGSLVHARLLPAVKPRGAERPTGSAVFLLDTSLSQRTALAPLCGKLLRAILERDATIERFKVIAFDVTARPLCAEWRSNTKESREKTASEVEAVWLEGATSIDAALGAAESALGEGEHATCFLLSDAIASWGIEDPRELERLHPRAFAERWVAYAFGDRPIGRDLATALTRRGGRVVTVLGSDALDAAATAHRTAPTTLSGVHIAGVSANHAIVAGSPSQLYPGEVLEVAFRTSDDPRKATIAIETDEGTQELALADTASSEPTAARAWAELTASALLDRNDRDADRVALALSQRFALANRVASFLMLETDAEYKTHELRTEDLDLDALVAAIAKREATRPAGAPRIDALDAKALAFLARVKGASCAPWPRRASVSTRTESFGKTSWPERLEPTAVHAEATRRFEGGRADEALRVLSSIVEENPRDGAALRFAAFTLMGWDRFADAERLFARAREVRPFEPQAYLGEALALEAQGRLGEAALRYEVVLAGSFDRRFGQYAKAAAKRLYGRLLARSTDTAGATERASALALDAPSTFELVLLWTIDDSDLDLHVVEEDGAAVDYRHKQSASGGALLWDNTAGLGPEIYRHPKQKPARAWVHYYGTRAVAGRVPAATLAVSFDRAEIRCVSSVLPDARAETTVFGR